jgi:Amt family ammonium transporter
MKNKFWLPLLGVFLIMTSGLALGQEAEVMEAVEEVAAEASATDILAYAVDNLFLLLSAVLVIFMQAGFAILESGLNHSKNTVNILMKNVMDFCLGVILYFFIGYGIMYPGEFNGYFGYAGVAGADNPAIADAVGGTLHVQVDFLFQAAFAATAATIVSGAVAGRMKFAAYMIYTVILTGIIYPISGSWKWGVAGWIPWASMTSRAPFWYTPSVDSPVWPVPSCSDPVSAASEKTKPPCRVTT